jgi:hypothetical protein
MTSADIDRDDRPAFFDATHNASVLATYDPAGPYLGRYRSRPDERCPRQRRTRPNYELDELLGTKLRALRYSPPDTHGTQRPQRLR